MSAPDGETKRILEHMASILSTDTTFRDWCNANLGSKANVYMGLNPRNLPQQAAYPLVTVFRAQRVGRGSARNAHEYAIMLGVGLHDTSEYVVTGSPGDGQLFELEQFYLIEAFRDMAEDAIYRQGRLKTWKVDTSGATSSEDDGQFYKSETIITVEVIAGSLQPVGKEN